MTKKHIAMFGATVALLTQFLPLSTYAQVRVLTPAQQTQLSEAAAKSFPVTILFSADAVKAIAALNEGGTTQITGVVREAGNTPLPMLVELREKEILDFYFPDGVIADPEGKRGIAFSGLNRLQRFIAPKLLPFDVEFPHSFSLSKKSTGPFSVSLPLRFSSAVQQEAVAQAGTTMLAPTAPAATPARLTVPAAIITAAVNAAAQNKAVGATIGGVRYSISYVTATNQVCVLVVGAPVVKRVCAAKPASGALTLASPGAPAAKPGAAKPPVPPPTPKLVTAPAARFDFGDAPAGFPTTRAENGPRHVLSNRVWLGAQIDGEADARRVNADNFDDGMVASNPQFILRVRTGARVAQTVYVNAWEDWNANNRWDINANGAPGDEWIVRNQPMQVRVNATQDVALVQPRNGPDGRPLPAAWSDPRGWVRFTVTETRIRNGNPAIGQLPSGETEDYVDVVRTIDEGGLRPPESPAPAGGGTGGGGSCGASQDCPNGYTCAIEGNVGTCVPTGGAVPATGGGLKSSAAPTRTFFGSLLELLRR
ncbi:MAG: hypothetical protein HYV25_00360 [Candidatus Harrisonbacteria bacterium]|nr:hypothetical protein [Candidatus Harrisonbacteria bacterium]